MTQIVPLNAVPAQRLSITLGGQVCQIVVYQKDQGLFLDLYVDDAAIITGVICQNQNRIVRYAYLGFSGDLVFFDTDTQNPSDPDFSGLGDRFQLAYLTAPDLAALGYAG